RQSKRATAAGSLKLNGAIGDVGLRLRQVSAGSGSNGRGAGIYWDGERTGVAQIGVCVGILGVNGEVEGLGGGWRSGDGAAEIEGQALIGDTGCERLVFRVASLLRSKRIAPAKRAAATFCRKLDGIGLSYGCSGQGYGRDGDGVRRRGGGVKKTNSRNAEQGQRQGRSRGF